MKAKNILLGLLLATAGLASAQTTDDPVLMTVNGTPVLRSEFEYSYNKNGDVEGAVEQKSVEEYAEMFLNYKLKVCEAVAQHLDTTQSFRSEFYQYRDIQLMPYRVD